MMFACGTVVDCGHCGALYKKKNKLMWRFDIFVRVAGHQGGTGRSPMTRTAGRLLELWPFVVIGLSAVLLH
jgi:hypothetical protein